ncbi:hypothetical protein CERSUDRAFT_101567 [Gelatoporia subvermispora B]|uniref:Uncharacterized protein n=1 Tax=Ceriporiopsis subvermispora (strain B) TaxID=914234 RepID=M2P527_CERS8|nr:hypothetical protein CERSUDRAFT_101567 [Gelatoporia subvermispora B]
MDRLAGNAGSRPPTERSEELAEQLLGAYDQSLTFRGGVKSAFAGINLRRCIGVPKGKFALI